MRTRKIIRCCLVTCLILFSFDSLLAQEGGKERIVVPMKDKSYYVAFTTTPAESLQNKEGWSTNFAEAFFATNSIRRIIVDGGRTLFYGYTLIVEPIPSSKQFKVAVRPLSPEDEQELRMRKAFQTRKLHPNYNAAGLARASTPQIINDGDTFALDVLVNPQTGDRITDFVTVSVDESRLSKAPVTDPPRDFTLEDVEMKMINYQLLVNGELVAGGKRSGACAGPVIWFHLPEKRGRFIFSLIPRPGYDFQRVGTIERNRMKFTVGDDYYEWISNTPVVSAAGNWNLYVLYDESYIPDPFLLGVNGATKSDRPTPSRLEELVTTYPSRRRAAAGFGVPPAARKEDEPDKSPGARLIIGAADRVENLLPKK